MIKLNNKNITYVALADSNNSLKAPKEIWYADSNNSVRLVYKRKDALIEGVDYEKYNLLNSYTDEGVTLPASGADIRVNAIPLNNKVLTIELGQISRNINVNGKSPWFIPIWSMYIKNLGYIMQLQERNGNDNTVHNMAYSWNTSNIVTLDFQNKVARLGNNSFNIDGSNYNFDGFHSIIWQNPRTVGKIKISDELHLVPCKLLKPVPKWLDANGIRRQVGECGMIDLVSGKFYGNVNNVGTFTVENYYERKEWLKGDGTAYIDTNVTSFSGVICIKFKKSAINGTRLFGRERRNTSVADYSDRCVLQYSNGYISIFGVNYVQLRSDIENEVLIDITNDTVYGIDGATASGFSITPNLDALSLYLFANHRNYGASDFSSDYISKFSITNSINLIPCTLTMDLPASMDANNIARTKGTSGMWDLVSDRFYGNVANGGAFKAVNLAEGVDYEVHQWLVGDGNTYIKVKGYTRNENWSITTSCRVRGAGVAGSYPQLYGCAHYNGDIYGSWGCFASINVNVLACRSTNTIDYLDKYFDYDINTIASIHDNHSSISINGVSKTQISDRIYFSNDEFWIYSTFDERFINSNTQSRIADADLSDFVCQDNGNTIIHLVPVKLLRSIPSKYDANGIERQVGECGMYDTVNDVFYGNVANSGTFSVSDDN